MSRMLNLSYPIIDKSSIHGKSGLRGGCSVNYRNEILIFGISRPDPSATDAAAKEDYHHVSFLPHNLYLWNVVFRWQN